MNIYPLGDSAIVIQFGTEIAIDTHHAVRAFADYLVRHPIPGMVEFIPAFTSVTVFYDPVQFTYSDVEQTVRQYLSQLEDSVGAKGRTIDIPVCYGGEFGPDITEVAEHNKISVEEVIKIHTSGEYLVYMIGFAPGFPYLGGMSERIATPRRANPRLSIPAGTVGIAGMQTGVYPIETPGGWRLIGRTPVQLFRPLESPPSLLQAGDVVRFYEISKEEFARLRERGDDS